MQPLEAEDESLSLRSTVAGNSLPWEQGSQERGRVGSEDVRNGSMWESCEMEKKSSFSVSGKVNFPLGHGLTQVDNQVIVEVGD